jgi:glucose-1-phosphate thymidylyltransferase
MTALILAAGYATRLYPLTRDFPKPLLEVGGKALVDHLLDLVAAIPEIRRVGLVTNHRFLPMFQAWQQRRSGGLPVDLLDDGTTSNETRRGAVGDLQFALEELAIADDLLVCAADNILRFPLSEFVTAFLDRRTILVCVHHVQDLARRRRTGIAVLGEQDRVMEFAEKPELPKSCWAVPPLYLYPRAVLPLVKVYLEAGGSPEAPGHLLEWLCRREPVHAYRVRGSILDIGTAQSLESAQRLFDAEAQSQPTSEKPGRT